MKTNRNENLSRRDFLGAAATASAFMFIPKRVLGQAGTTPPSEKLNIAVIGAGGQGGYDIQNYAKENIVALCDVDEKQAAGSFNAFPNARRYQDFRVMLDEEAKNIDAVHVATPDHVHAVASIAAMKRGKHVYTQKPLTHDLFEAREMVRVAREQKVMTQMGIQIHATEGYKLGVEIIKSGMLGKVREVHIWSDRPSWNQACNRPAETPPVPAGLDWDLWLGPARERPYHPTYAPFGWRGWYDFGTGALGDMGCHIIDPACWALDLGSPTEVEAQTTRSFPESYPAASLVRWQFPARGELPPLTLTWYDGLLQPFKPGGWNVKRRLPESGGLYIGEKAMLLLPHGGDGPRLIPEEKMQGFQRPPRIIPRGIDHYQDWVRACKGGPRPLANFDYAGPLTEIVLLGCLAVRFSGEPLAWDGAGLKVTNQAGANNLVRREYRQGWEM